MSDLAAVQAATASGQWQLALELLGNQLPTETAERLELRAQALYGNGEFEASIATWEHLHRLCIANNDTNGAAMAATMVAMFLMMDTGLMAPVRGWLRRAERLLDGHAEAPAHAFIAVVHGYERFMCGDMSAARQWSTAAIALGQRLGANQAVVIGRVCAARITIFEGRVDEGLDLLDDIADDLMSGAADPLTTGIMYCELICAAQGLAHQARAIEWTEVMERWSHGAAIGAVGGRCRVHRAELLRISGPAELAEREALDACAELRPFMRREFGWPLVELGNIRLRKGDLAGAEEAFMAAHEHAWSPHPGLALLRLAQGDVKSAAAMIADAIAHPFEIPSKERPPFGDLRLAPLLDAQAEIAAAAGDRDTLRAATHALESIANSYRSPSLVAAATLAHARLALASGDAEGAIHAAQAATAAWVEIGAPFDAATARMVLGAARHQSGDEAGAAMEWRAAHAGFTQFGAPRSALAAQRLASGASPAAVSGPHHGPTATFRCDSDTRTIAFGDITVLMRDLKGFRYLERLLADPGREFHVLDLVAVERGSLPTGRATGHVDGELTEGAGAGLPMIDDEARAAYRRRLADVDEDIEEATRLNDIGRVELAQRDRQYLIHELTRAAGLGHRARTQGGTNERARTSVTRSLRYALERMAEHHPTLAAHLGQSLHTGTYCVYAADPIAPISWQL